MTSNQSISGSIPLGFYEFVANKFVNFVFLSLNSPVCRCRFFNFTRA